MKAVTFSVLAVIAMMAFGNTFGRAMINDHHAEVTAKMYAEKKAKQKAEDVAACTTGKTSLIMVDGKFCSN